ncbi:MAG: AAA family ATPase, partial [Xanthobacteraceae bacterium]
MPQHSKTTSGFKTNAQLDDEIMHRESMNGASGPTLPFINMSRWDHELPPRQEWGVHERIPIHQTALFTGEGAAGKSRVEIHGCVAHVLGKDWLKTLPEPGPAILVECEDDEAELHRRAAAVVKFYGSTFKEAIAGGLHLMSLAGKDAALATVAKTGKIEPTAIYHQLLQAAGDIRPKRISIA